MEKHLESCAQCLRTLRTLAALDDALDSFLLAPPPPFNVAKVVADLLRPAPHPRSMGKIALGLVAALLALLGWLYRGSLEASPPEPPRASPRAPVAIPTRPLRMSAPKRVDQAPPDAGPNP